MGSMYRQSPPYHRYQGAGARWPPAADDTLETAGLKTGTPKAHT